MTSTFDVWQVILSIYENRRLAYTRAPISQEEYSRGLPLAPPWRSTRLSKHGIYVGFRGSWKNKEKLMKIMKFLFFYRFSLPCGKPCKYYAKWPLWHEQVAPLESSEGFWWAHWQLNNFLRSPVGALWRPPRCHFTWYLRGFLACVIFEAFSADPVIIRSC